MISIEVGCKDPSNPNRYLGKYTGQPFPFEVTTESGRPPASFTIQTGLPITIDPECCEGKALIEPGKSFIVDGLWYNFLKVNPPAMYLVILKIEKNENAPDAPPAIEGS